MVSMVRPRRLAAIKGVQDAVGSLKRQHQQRKGDMGDSQPKSGSLARPTRKKAVSTQNRATVHSATRSENDQEEEDDEDESESESDEDNEDEADEYQPTKKQKTNLGAKATKSKQRLTETNKPVQAKRKQNLPAIGPSRTRKGGGNKDDLDINSDNELFNAIQGSDLRSTAQDWMTLYVEDQPKALARYLNFVLRTCGSNESIDEAQAMDVDNAVEVLEAIQITFKTASNPSYPLLSKAPAFRKFRRSISQLMEHIFTAASEADVLDDETLIDTIVTWLGAMSTSKYRAFRHTATALVLMMMGQIARLNKEAREKFEQLSKQKDSENSKKNPSRYKALMDQINSVNMKRKLLDTFHQELEEAVFIHRYRDSDPTIRADCMEELGRWMLICPSQFLTGNYLRYFAWEMSDENASVRMVVVQGLRAIFLRHQSSNALENFTLRFLTRMMEIAVGDVDLNVRIAMINTLLHVDQTMGLDDEEARETLARHIFDTESKVRAVVARFFSHIVEKRITGAKDEDKMRFKQMASFILHLRGEDDDEKDNTSSVTHISRALESILAIPECPFEWDSLIELLQMDHSASTGRRRGGVINAREEYRLEAKEENILLECVQVMLRTAKESSIASITNRKPSDGEQEEVKHAQMTQQLMIALPNLFTKYKTEAGRITKVLALLPHMDIASYLEYQQMASYEILWDNVIDQFERHTEIYVVNSAAEAIASLANAKALNTVNEEKLFLLRQRIISAAQESSSFEHLLEARNLQVEELHRLSACTNRLKLLFRHVNLCQDVDESGEENRNGGIWDILLACAQRISLDREEEGELIENAIVSLGLYIIWKTNAIVNMDEETEKAAQAEILLTKLQPFLSACQRILEAQSSDGNRAAQRQAFRHMLDVYIIYGNLAAIDEERKRANADTTLKLPPSLYLTCTTGLQDHLANFVARECERCRPREDENEEGEDEFGTLEKEEELAFIVSHYVGAIRLGIIDIRKSADILAHYGQMGELYDACLRTLIEAIREVGIQDQKPRTACSTLSDTLIKAQTLNNANNDEANLIHLAKLLSSCLVVRGAHLTILQRIDSKELIKMHEDLINQILKGQVQWIILKALAQLVISFQPNEALKIQVGLNKILEQIDATSISESDQDAIRTYEKRLVTLASKTL